LPLILKDRKPEQYYVEPFCGSCSVIQQVDNPRIAADKHYYLIELLKWIEKGWIPPDVITEEEYKIAKNRYNAYQEEYIFNNNSNDNIIIAYIGFVGFCCSFSGKWWGGYARGNDNKGKPRNFAAEQKRDILKQAPLIKGIDFRCVIIKI
jgi:DNA adenine methylase